MNGRAGHPVCRCNYCGERMFVSVQDQFLHGGISRVQIIQALLDQIVIDFQTVFFHCFNKAFPPVFGSAFLYITAYQGNILMSQPDKMIHSDFRGFDIVQNNLIALQIVRFVVKEHNRNIAFLIYLCPAKVIRNGRKDQTVHLRLVHQFDIIGFLQRIFVGVSQDHGIIIGGQFGFCPFNHFGKIVADIRNNQPYHICFFLP